MALSSKNLQQTLQSLGLLSDEQFELVNNKVKTKGKTAKQVILEEGFVDEEVLIKAQAILLDVPFINLEKAIIPPEVLQVIPEKISLTYDVICFHRDQENRTIKIAMANPADFHAIEYLETKTNSKVEPYMATMTQIRMFQNDYKAIESEVRDALEEAKEDTISITSEVSSEASHEDESSVDAPVTRIVNTILEFAIKEHSSDIHIEPMEDKTRVRYRTDGILIEAISLPSNVHSALVSRVKIMSRLKIDEKRVPQDGRFRAKINSKEFDFRVSTLPSIFGEKIVMRVLDRSSSAPPLEKLGYRGQQIDIVKKNMEMPNGMILTTGPTGSGKSTSLFSILSELNTPEVNSITLEDPVEYWLNGVTQVQINNQAGMTFASGLRAVLRQDPDIVMVGEIRDQETAEMAIHAALTGHLVVSTLHTNSAAGAIPRFLDMGVEPFLLASSLRAIIGQRLARKICPDCMTWTDAEPDTVKQIHKALPELFGDDEEMRKNIYKWYPDLPKDIHLKPIQILKPKGCPTCGDKGYKGRIGVYEVLEATEEIQSMTIKNSSEFEILQKAKDEYHMLTLKQDAFIKALEGKTTLQEALRVAQN